MILRSIRAEGLGCFADSFTTGQFTPGINVLYAPNGTGKSTLFRAVSLAFLEPHRGKSVEVQALRPWARRLAPQVAVEFEHSGRIYRIRKRFLDGVSAHLETREGESWTSFAQGDHADQFLRELLQCDSDKPRSGKREHWGLAQLLWTTQGDLSLPPLASSVVESIRGSVGAQLSARESALVARVKEEYLKFFSPTAGRLKGGANAAPLKKLQLEQERLEGELQTAEELLRQFEAESGRIQSLRTTEKAAAARREVLAKELDELRASAEEFRKLCSEQRERVALRDTAQVRYKTATDRIQSIEQARRQAVECEKSLAALSVELPVIKGRVDKRQKLASEAEQARATAGEAEEAARMSLRTAQTADRHARAIGERTQLSQRLAELAAADEAIRTADEDKKGMNAPSDAQLRELRSVLAKETDARRRLDLARVTVGFVPDARFEVQVIAGEQAGTVVCEPGVRVMLPGAPNLVFAIPGVGRFEATGPVTDYESVRRDLEKQQARLTTFSTQFASIDPDVLETRRQQAAQLDVTIREAKTAIARLLDGVSSAGLQALHLQAVETIEAIELEHPSWQQQAPDASAILAAANAALTDSSTAYRAAESAARTAAQQSSEGQSLYKLATGRQASLQEQLDQARRSLESCLSDGVVDAQRRKIADDAALDVDICRLALAKIENGLKRFNEDPAIATGRLVEEIACAEVQAGKARDERLRAETHIQGLVDRRPYTASSETAERLSDLREQIDREQRRMDALALLQKTLEEARTQMMVEVAAPVERIATDFLEEICGKPLAEIRLSQTLAAERVIPTSLGDSSEPGVDLERLSGGEREQVYLCTRIALGSEVARRERQMLVLDDVLTSTDEERMTRVCRLLAKVSDRLQLIILTCHPERFANLPGANRIDLGAALGRATVAAYV